MAHRDLSQRLGFKGYQMIVLEATERFMQIIFLAWTIIVIASAMNTRTVVKEMGISKFIR